MGTASATVPDCYGVSSATFPERRRGDESLDIAACLTRRLTTATLRELAGVFDLSHPRRLARPFCHTDILEFIKLDFGVFQ